MKTEKPVAAEAQTVKKERETKDVPLDDPIVRGDTEITSLRLKKPRGKEAAGLNLLEIAQMNTSVLIDLLPRIAEPLITKSEAEDMSISDLMACAVAVAGFLPQKAQLG